jgi:hypothetical protein
MTAPLLTRVMSKHNEPIGYINAKDDNFITVIPWSSVERYNGSEVFLKITEKETRRVSAGL